MKIKNKLRYIFIFGIVLALLLSLSFNVFADSYRMYSNIVNYYYESSVSYSRQTFTCNNLYFKYNDEFLPCSYIFQSAYSYPDRSRCYIRLMISTNNQDYIIIEESGYSDPVNETVDLYYDVNASISCTYGTLYSLNGYGSQMIADTNYSIDSSNNNSLFSRVYASRYDVMDLSVTFNFLPLQSSSPLTKTYDVGSFYNNNTLYNQIIVDGVSEDSSSFSDITSITYKHSTENYQAISYSNSSWTSGYNSNLQYFWNGTAPTVSNINSDLNSLITFSTSVLSTELDKSYNLDFQQNGNYYTSVRVVGTTINGNNFNSIQSIYYNSDQIYVNNNYVLGYSNYLGYTFTPPDSTVLSNLNSDLGGLLVFYTVQVNPTPEEKFFHDIDVSTNGILTIVYAFANNLLSNILLITMCIALPLVSFAVVQVIRIYKIKKGQ